MKFSDGVWQTAKGMAIASPHHVFDLAVSETEVIIDASSCPYRARFEDVNTAYFTLRLFSPAPNVIGVKFEHFRGHAIRGPTFEIDSDPSTKPEIVNEKDLVSLTSGDLSVRVERRDDWRLDVLREGKRITGSALGSSGYATDEKSGRTYVFERLDLGVGDLVYGLGERFTAFTKNGQSVEIWNRDGGTSTEQAYKNIPFFLTNRGWGVLVNQPEKASFEVGSEFVSKVGFSVEGESLEYLIIDGPTPKGVLDRYTRLTGRPALPPPWSFGLWLTTSFTTDYDEKTVSGFVEGMRERDLPLHVFHFDCFWMRPSTGATSNGTRRHSPNPRACSPGSRPRTFESIPISPKDRGSRHARLRPFGDRRLPTLSRPLGRRQFRELRIDGREPARRIVARPLGLRFLEPRHWRLPEQGAGRRLQALVRVRPAFQPQPAARLHVLPCAVALRRRGGRRAALFHQAQVPADALPLRGGRRGGSKRGADDAGDGPRISRRSGLRDA
jgi:hypothetical protein